MNETKFKFWHTKLKKMSKSCSLGIIYEHLCESFGCAVDWEDIVKCQFTGLKDKNGKGDVWDGDEVMATTRGEMFLTKPGIVKFHRGAFVVNLYGEDIDDARLAYDFYELELTGKNIHQNPELLKGE